MEINFIDLILIVIFIGTILQGYARGFILSLISFAKYLVGVPLSFFIADSYNVAVYNNFVKDAVSQKISDGLSSAGDIDSFTASLQNAVSELPFGLSGAVDLSFLNGVTSSNITAAVMKNIVEPISLAIIKIVLFILTLVVFSVLVWLISKLVKNVVKIEHTPLKNANKFLGAVFGALKGLITLAALCVVIVFLRDYLFASSQEFVSQADTSAVMEFINKLNPLLNMI